MVLGFPRWLGESRLPRWRRKQIFVLPGGSRNGATSDRWWGSARCAFGESGPTPVVRGATVHDFDRPLADAAASGLIPNPVQRSKPWRSRSGERPVRRERTAHAKEEFSGLLARTSRPPSSLPVRISRAAELRCSRGLAPRGDYTDTLLWRWGDGSARQASARASTSPLGWPFRVWVFRAGKGVCNSRNGAWRDHASRGSPRPCAAWGAQGAALYGLLRDSDTALGGAWAEPINSPRPPVNCSTSRRGVVWRIRVIGPLEVPRPPATPGIRNTEPRDARLPVQLGARKTGWSQDAPLHPARVRFP